jgi:hypothetical protein
VPGSGRARNVLKCFGLVWFNYVFSNNKADNGLMIDEFFLICVVESSHESLSFVVNVVNLCKR